MSDSEDAFRSLVERAQELTAQRRWQGVGDTWISAARVALDARAIDAARQAFEAAGEAYRRDDRPLDSRRALESALTLPMPPASAALGRVRLAGVLGELGEGGEALRLCAEAGDLADASVLAVVLDTRIGLLQGFGRKAELRPVVDELEAAEGPAGIACWFRRGQLQRLDGQLEAADASFERVLERLRDRPGAEAGAAAAEMERAELLALSGDPGPAIAAFERGGALHQAAGRHAHAYRCVAGQIRAAVAAGADTLPHALSEGMAFAERRGMVVLAIDMRLARGMASASRDATRARQDLLGAAADAERLGARLRAGRARLECGARAAANPTDARALLTRAVADLHDHVPLHDRALATLNQLG